MPEHAPLFQTVHVADYERAVVFDGPKPIQALGPGWHRVVAGRYSHRRWDTRELIFDATPDVLAILPRRWFDHIELSPRMRGVIHRAGRPRRFLRPGVTRFWTVDPSIQVQVWVVDVSVTARTPHPAPMRQRRSAG